MFASDKRPHYQVQRDGNVTVSNGRPAGAQTVMASAGVQTRDTDVGGTVDPRAASSRTHDKSGLCVDVSGAATANGSKIILWSCHGGTNQQWSLRN